RYTTGGQDAHPTRVLLLKFVPHSNGICCIYYIYLSVIKALIFSLQPVFLILSTALYLLLNDFVLT
ncbi:MAG: hypothetical protein ACKPER_19580, partial [Dolichospermum sp.]